MQKVYCSASSSVRTIRGSIILPRPCVPHVVSCVYALWLPGIRDPISGAGAVQPRPLANPAVLRIPLVRGGKLPIRQMSVAHRAMKNSMT